MRTPADEDDANPLRGVEKAGAEAVSASLDYYREIRDALSEAAFFQTYGNVFSLYLADKGGGTERAAEVVAEARELPYVKEALAAIDRRRLSGGGFTHGCAARAARHAAAALVDCREEGAARRTIATLLPDLPPDAMATYPRRTGHHRSLRARSRDRNDAGAALQAGGPGAAARARDAAHGRRAHPGGPADCGAARDAGVAASRARARRGADRVPAGRPRTAHAAGASGDETRRRRIAMAREHVKYQRLIDYCKALPPTPVAVAHPCDESSLRSAVDAARWD